MRLFWSAAATAAAAAGEFFWVHVLRFGHEIRWCFAVSEPFRNSRPSYNPPTPADARGSAPGNKTPLPPTPADKRGMRATPAGQGGARKGKGVSA